jgi:hypothetical protein
MITSLVGLSGDITLVGSFEQRSSTSVTNKPMISEPFGSSADGQGGQPQPRPMISVPFEVHLKTEGTPTRCLITIYASRFGGVGQATDDLGASQ